MIGRADIAFEWASRHGLTAVIPQTGCRKGELDQDEIEADIVEAANHRGISPEIWDR